MVMPRAQLDPASRCRPQPLSSAKVPSGSIDRERNKGGTAEANAFRPLLYKGRKAFFVGLGLILLLETNYSLII